MGENGVGELDLHHFVELGFLNPAASYISIKSNHRSLMQNYTVQSQYGLSDGPKNVQLLSTNAPFKKLESTKPAAVMAWYKNLVSTLSHYNICLTPFDIVLKYGEVGLCLPGVGWMKYKEMGAALSVLLTTNLLPLDEDSILPKQLTQKLRLANKSNNGYKILHRLLEEVIVGYKLDSLEMTWPRYRNYECVFAFAEHMMLTFELAQKHDFNPTAFQLAKLYLDSIKKEAGDKLKMAALILENDLKKFDKKKALPEAFELDHLAYALSESIEETDDSESFRKQVYHTSTSMPPSTSTSTTTAISSITHEPTMNQEKDKQVQFSPPTALPIKAPSPGSNDHIQGYSLRKYYANEVYRKNGRARPQSRPAPNPRRLTRNRRRRPYDPNKRCNACNRIGHDANSCDHLGVSCFIERFRTDGANAEIVRQAEETWVHQNDQYLVQPPTGDTRTPSQVLRNYMDKYGFDFETVEDEMDWIYFGNDCQDGDDVEEDAIDLGALSLS
jgi:hypothetical protein